MNTTSLAEKLESIAQQLRAVDALPLPIAPPIAVSIDGRSARWFGTLFEFTPAQAAAVKLLWEAHENGTPVIGGETILHRIGCSEGSRLCHIFDKGNHHAWGTMIISGTPKNSFRIAQNPPQPHGSPQLPSNNSADDFITRLRS